jgi:hypothetical protein
MSGALSARFDDRWRRPALAFLIASAAFFWLILSPAKAAAAQITISLDPTDSSKVVFSPVTGMSKIHTYEADGCTYPAPAGTYDYLDLPATQAGTPWKPNRACVDAVAWDSSNQNIGTWYSSSAGGSRVLTKPSPNVSFTSPTGTTLSGSVTWQVSATPTDSSTISKVDFYIDGTLMWTENLAPYVYNGDGNTLDTTTLSNGSHTLKAVATTSAGGYKATSSTFTVNNAPTGQLTIQLDPNDSSKVDFLTIPNGTASVHVYEADGSTYPAPAGTYDYLDLTPAQASQPWHPNRACVDAVAMDGSGNPIGTWYSSTPGGSRVCTSSPPPPPPSGLAVGVVGGWGGTSHIQDVASIVPWVRLESFGSVFDGYTAAGSKVDKLFAGCPGYNTGGVAACGDPASVAASALSSFNATTNATETPRIEVFNEPYGSWFWGSNASSATNARAYTKYLKAFYQAFHPLGVKILASWENDSWGGVWQNATAANGGVDNPLQYVDEVTVHPYGGSSGQSGGANGNRTAVLHAASVSGKPVFVSEVGWPTCGATADSQNWTVQQQANNVYNFVTWARQQGTGVVSGVTFYNDVDESSTRCYGNTNYRNSDGSLGGHKPAYTALADAAAGLPYP